MPGFKFDALDDDAPLFTEPFWLELPGVKGKFDIEHRVRLVDDADLMPLEGYIVSLAAQIVSEQREAFTKALKTALLGDPPTIQLQSVIDALEWIGKERQAAEKRAVEAQSGRPTGARSRSQRSSG